MTARIAPCDDFNSLMRAITDRQLAIMGLPPLPDHSNAPVQRGSPLWERLRVPDQHDFRDRGNPLEKVDPDPRHWSRWAERTEFDWREP